MLLQWRVMGAVLRKDLRCVWPAVLLAAAVFGGDVFVTRLDLWPVWEAVRQPLVLLSAALLVFAVFQLDSPVSLVDDWLCRPVPRRELVIAKSLLVVAAIYGSRVLATLIVDVADGRPARETLADTVLLQDDFFVLALALLVMIGVTTRNAIQAIGTLVGTFMLVLVVPTAFNPAAGPLRPDIGESLLTNGMGWLVSAPVKLLAVVGVVSSCVLVYGLRRTRAARVWLVACALAGLAVFIVPMWYVPWSRLAATQASAPTGRISLQPLRACFPAARLDKMADGAFAALRQSGRMRWWSDRELAAAGPESLAFVTSVQARGLPHDWRAQLAFVHAQYHGADGRSVVDLRPTHYGSSGVGAFTHAWLLPAASLANLQQTAATEAEFRYSFALLEPRKHALPLDGRRHRLPELGYCGAHRASVNNAIEVECLVTGTRVAQVSAELPSIEPSAVYGPLDYGPAWLRWPRAPRLKLTLASARLSTAQHVDVIAWKNAGLVEQSLSVGGLLGGEPDTCPLPDSTGAQRLQASRWRDATPHEPQLVAVDTAVSLEVLDFGGQGSPLLLVPGLGATAHSFDTLAPRLAEHHRVFAMTRRGSGASSRVDFGYDTPRLARDIVAVLDSLGLPKATLVGHSIAGDELTWLGGHHADRVSGLVYLDAAYDRSVPVDPVPIHELQQLLPSEPPIRENDLLDYASFKALQARRDGPLIPEGEMIAFRHAGQPFLTGTPDIDPRVAEAIPAALQRPDYRALKVPALAVYATAGGNRRFKPWIDPNDQQQMRALREIGALTERAKRASIEQLRSEAPVVEIVELPGADHWIFLSHEREVVEAIERFAAR